MNEMDHNYLMLRAIVPEREHVCEAQLKESTEVCKGAEAEQ